MFSLGINIFSHKFGIFEFFKKLEDVKEWGNNKFGSLKN
jgi:hypothetical protein